MKILIVLIILILVLGGGYYFLKPAFESTLVAPIETVSDEEANFYLYVSNQSFDIDPVDIQVVIDDQIVINGEFEVRNQHNWLLHPFKLSSGEHEIKVMSKKGEAEISEKFTIDGPLYAVLDYFYSEKSDDTSKSFSFTTSLDPIGFD